MSALRIPYQFLILSISIRSSSRLLLSRRRTSICLFMGRTSPPGRTSKYTPRTPHPQQQATPHTPGWTSSPPPAGLQINILIARLIYTASRSSLGRGRTSSLVRAASHTTHLSAASITPCFHIHSGGDTTLTPYSIYYAINELRRLWRG